MAVRRPSMAIASARDDLYIDYRLSYGHQGTMVFSPHHREAAGLVGSPVDLGIASETSFAMLACHVQASPPTGGGEAMRT